MKAVIDRKSGSCDYSLDVAYHSAQMTAYGQVERIHTGTEAWWYPTWDMVEGFLAGRAPEDIPLSVTKIEGRFLIIYRTAGQVFVFNDRYCFYRTYYRLTPTSLELFDRVLGEVPHPQINQSDALALLMFRFLPGRRTLFDQINQLMGGECLVLDLPTGRFHSELSCVYPKKEYAPLGDLEAAQTFHELFRETLDVHLQTYSPDETLLIPLSGGFDSRYLLGTLLELVPPSRILTFTFGTPGTYDFEIGPQVARKAGVRNITYPLSLKDFSREALIQNCADTDAQILYSIETPMSVFYRMAEHGRLIFSGNPGNGYMGELFRELSPLDDRASAMADIILPPDDPLIQCYDEQILQDSLAILQTPDSSPLTLGELWCFVNHIPKYSNQCVYKMNKHFEYISPFMDYAFVDFVMNLPVEMRLDRKLYFYWLERHFPELASIPCAFFNGVPLTASRYKKLIAKQWDRVLRKILQINRRANKIDLKRNANKLLDFQRLDNFASEAFTPDTRNLILRPSPSRYLLLYGLQSLEILCSTWDVTFMKGLPEAEPAKMQSETQSIQNRELHL